MKTHVLQHMESSKYNRELIEMTENYIKLDIKSFQDMCKNITELTEENKSLRLDNDFLEKQNTACKLRCSKLSIQVRELESEIADMRFTRKYLTSEEAGRQFARELLGGA